MSRDAIDSNESQIDSQEFKRRIAEAYDTIKQVRIPMELKEHINLNRMLYSMQLYEQAGKDLTAETKVEYIEGNEFEDG